MIMFQIIALGYLLGSIKIKGLNSVSSTIVKATVWARKKYRGLPVLFSGGVSVCSILQDHFSGMDNIYFAQKGLGGDNALGAALLADMEMKKCR